MARQPRPLRVRDVQTYRACEGVTEILIYLMVLFSPWAFGTTQPWAIRTMNIAGYALGLLLAIKLAIRHFKDYRPPRWGEAATVDRGRHSQSHPYLIASNLTSALVWLTAAILAYCFISAVNARATYDASALSFVDHGFLRWLPYSSDSHRTWAAFWNYLALACAFWAVRDWLLGKTIGEQRAKAHGAGREAQGAEGRAEQSINLRPGGAPPFPARLRRLLWLLAVNGGLLGLEGIAQRLEGSGKLLFLVKPRVNPGAESQFGPYAYRSNAAQYFNLLWPVVLGFWWILQRSGGVKRHAHHLLLICSAIMAACPIISISRGGALITVGILVLAGLLLVAGHFIFPARRQKDGQTGGGTLTVVTLFIIGSLALGFSLGWKALKPRMTHLGEGFEGREEMYAAARPMSHDYPVYGVGPGAFETVFQMYRISTETYWPAQLHNDWLETLITFGWAGTALILLALVTVTLRWFARGGIHGGRRFVVLMWLALAGCLIHARFDFPFQIYSIVFLFLVLGAILFNLSRQP